MQKLLGAALACASVALVCGAGVAGTKAAKDAPKMVSRSEKFLSCAELKSSQDGEGEGDFIQYKCASEIGPPMWMLIQEGVRFSFGFGKKENMPQSAAGDAEGAIEWWGSSKTGKFVPATVIKRFTFSDYGDPETRSQQLVVFRLLKNGKSCVLAVLAPSKTENAEARKVAQGNSACLQ